MKKCLCMFLAFVFVLGICASAPITITASAASVNDLTFELSDDGTMYQVSDCSLLASGSLEIPSTYKGLPVTRIAQYAFNCSDYLTSVTIPYGVTSIGESAFYYCQALENVTIPDSMISIGAYAFSECSSLKNITLPYGMTQIGRWAFEKCASLESVSIPATVTHIDWYTFSGCTSLKSVTIPGSVTNIDTYAFEDCSALTEVTIPYGVTSIGESAFEDCLSLTSVTIPDSVKHIGMSAFFNCPSLKSVTIPDSVEFIAYESLGYRFDSWEKVVAKVNDFTIYGAKGSAAETYAKENGFTFIEKESSGAHTHSYTEEILKPATCTEKGSTKYSCSCGYIFTEDTPALGHNYSSEFTIDKYPSYESAGSQSRHCTRCDATTDVTVLPKLEKFDPPVITKAVSEKNGVRLTWQPVAGVESYMVFKLIDGKYTQIAVLNPSATTYLDSDVEEGETYCYAIASTNYMGDPGDYSEIAVKYTKAVKLQTPTVSRANTTKGIKVTWNAVPDAESYIVYRGIYNAKTKKWSGWKVVKNGYTGTTYTDTTVKLGTYYRYTVRAVSGESKSAYKATKGLKYNVTPTVKVANASNGIKVSWTTAANATGYAVYTSTYNASTKKWSGWKYRGTTAASTKSWVDKSAKSSTYYKYTVRAVNGSFKSSYKSSANVIRLLTPTVKASAQKNGIKITWNKIAGAKNYKIYRSEYVNGQWTSWTYIAARTYKALSYVDTTVSGGHTYRYTVRAVNGNSAGAYRASNQVNAPVKASPVTTLKNYLKQNGELSRDGDYYYIDYIEEVDNIEYEYTIWYDWYEDEISFSLYLYDYEKDSEHMTDMVFVPNAVTQDVTMIYFADSYDEYYGMGYVYTNETFTSDSYIYDFRISEGSEQLRESSAKLALLTTEIMLKKCDKMLSSRNVGVSMYDLGFKNLYN